MTMLYRGVSSSVGDLEDGRVTLESADFHTLTKLYERQQHAMAHDKTLNATQRDWLARDIEMVENELERRWTAGED